MKRTWILSLVVVLAGVGLCEADWACPKCKKSNADDNAFCGKCGTKAVWACPKCKHQNTMGSAFCGKCGAKRGQLKPTAPPPKPTPPKPTPPKPVPPKPAATGPFAGWTPVKGKWTVKGEICTQSAGDADSRFYAPPAKWKDYVYEARVRKTGGKDGFAVLFRVKDPKNFYWWILGLGNKQHIVQRIGGKTQNFPAVPGKIQNNKWYTVRILVVGDLIRCYLDGKLVHDIKDKTHATGGIGLATRSSQVAFTDVRVTSLDGKRLYGIGRGVLPLPPRMPPPPTLDAQVEKAIDAGIQYLWSQWNAKEAHWEGYGKQVDKKTKKVSYRYPVGSTALAAYALLEAGVTPQDERMGKTLEWMAKQPCTKTYSLGVRASAWHAANRTSDRKYIKQLAADARTLVHGGAHYGRYHYDVKGVQTAKSKGFDNSCSQYGVLGVWAAARDGGLEIPVKYWERVMEHWLKVQGPTGGWGYTSATGKDKKTGKVTDASRPTMTTAGLATLYVCLDNLYASRYIACRGNKEADIAPIAKGMAWLEKRFAAAVKGGGHWCYFLYCMERVGLASGKKYFGTADWYRTATLNLLPKQKDGKWGNGVVDTSFALLFLVRGRHPVLFNRLQYDGDWNNRPRALASLTRWISRNFEKTVNWQVIDIRTSVSEWHDAPILCITGALAPKFSDADIAKLRTYVQQGGTILSVTECGGRPFTTAIRAAYAKMFPNYELVPLSKDHPIYSSHFPLRGTPKLSAISNGVRPLAIHCDVDLPLAWQAGNSVTQATYYRTAANVYMYVTAKGDLRNRAATAWPTRTKMPAALPLRVARIKHNGNCNPEPLALARLQRLMANECLVNLQMSGPLPATDLPKSKAAVAFLTGTNAFTLTPTETAALKEFCKGGGLLIIDAAGGGRVEKDPATQVFKPVGFAASAEALLAKMYPALPPARLSSQAHLLSLKEYKIDRVRYRADTRNRLGMMKTANLRAVVPGNRIHVIYSPEDLTAGLLGYTGAHVDGYTPESAYELVRNAILDNISRPRPKAKPAPAAKDAK